MGEDIKNCPFCNGEAVDGNPMQSMSSRTPKTVKCSNYRCILSRLHFSIEAWNNRPIEDALRQEVERLRALTKPRMMCDAPTDGTHILAMFNRHREDNEDSLFIEVWFDEDNDNIFPWFNGFDSYETECLLYWIPVPEVITPQIEGEVIW